MNTELKFCDETWQWPLVPVLANLFRESNFTLSIQKIAGLKKKHLPVT